MTSRLVAVASEKAPLDWQRALSIACLCPAAACLRPAAVRRRGSGRRAEAGADVPGADRCFQQRLPSRRGDALRGARGLRNRPWLLRADGCRVCLRWFILRRRTVLRTRSDSQEPIERSWLICSAARDRQSCLHVGCTCLTWLTCSCAQTSCLTVRCGVAEAAGSGGRLTGNGDSCRSRAGV